MRERVLLGFYCLFVGFFVFMGGLWVLFRDFWGFGCFFL